MNVTCTGCPAKYAVPDEKVRGKKVRITCKHCGTNIVVDGSALSADQSVAPKGAATASVHQISSLAPKEPVAPVAAPAKEPVAAKPPAEPVETTYVVGFLDERQEPHTVSQIVDMYNSGSIDDEALVWKDGMSDWLTPFDVPEIAAAALKRGVTRRKASTELASAEDQEQTLVVRSPFEDDEAPAPEAPAPVAAPLFAAPVAAAPVAAAPIAAAAPKAGMFPSAATTTSPKPFAAAASPVAAAASPVAAARRAEKRGGAVDLFGGMAEAGSETDTSLDFGASEEPAHKLTGARNESSVLFSLDALTKPDPKANQKQKARDREDEKQASAAMFGDSAPDSLMNLGGGGLAALAAPDFSKPVSAAAVEAAGVNTPLEVPTETPTKSRGITVLLVFLVPTAAVAAGAFYMMKREPPPAPAPQAETAAVKPSEPPATTATTASSEPSSPSLEASAPAAASAEPAPAASAAPNVAGAKPATPAAAAPAAAAVNKPAEPATPATPVTPAPAPAAEGAAFDKNAAVAALGAAAASAASCKKPDGPTGSGKASVTFAPSGRATATNVSGAFAGTEVGGCVARLFRAAKVPPFAGDPVTVSKSFSIE